jgi:hypothetical protein
MADSLVSSAHTSALSSRNQEPTHLPAASGETLGGPAVGGESSVSTDGTPIADNAYKINGATTSTDGSIPKAVGPEASHRGEMKSEDKDPDVEFDDEDKLDEGDDLDAQLDQMEAVDVDVDLDKNKDKDDLKDDLKEDGNPFAKKDDKKSDDDDKDDDKEDKVKDGRHLETEDKENPFAKKDDDDKDDDKKEKVEESFKVRIKLPAVTISEEVLPAANQQKVTALFEQALRSTIKDVNKQLAGHYRALHEEKIAKRDAVMAKQMDAYLSYVVEEWVKQNKVSIRQSLRAQLSEEFLNGLQRLFKEHYIDVPESKVDVVQKLTEQNEKLRGSVNEAHAKSLKLRKLAEAANKGRIVAEFARKLTEADAAKLHKLAEDVVYKTAKDFRSRLTVLKENYFPATKPAVTPAKTQELPAEQVVIKEEVVATKKDASSSDPDVAAIAETLSRQALSSKW